MRDFATFLLLLSVQCCFAQNYSIKSIPLELLENADAVMRLDAMDLEVLSPQRMSYTVKQVVSVLNPKGDRYADARVHFDGDEKIVDLEALILDSNGQQIRRFKKRDFKDVAAVDGFSLYIDNRVLYLEQVPVQYPYTLVFTYGVETPDTGAFPSWNFVPGPGISVEKSAYAIHYAPDAPKPLIRERNLAGLEVERQKDNGLLRYVLKGVPAYVQEPLSPSPAAYAPRLSARLPNFQYKGYHAEIGDWGEMGLWLQQLFKGRDALDPTSQRTVQKLVEGVDDDLEKAKIVHRYVQKSTRYVSVQMGIGGIQPISAMEVARDHYGDCKGLTNYTQALLKAVGVESHYVVVEAGSDKVDLEEDFASLDQGNHVILGIPYQDDYYWVDCTSQVLPFGYLGDFTDDRKVLVVKPDGGEIMTTPSYLDGDNFFRTEATYRVLEDLSMKAELTLESGGIRYNDRMGLDRALEKEVKEHYRQLWDNLQGLSILEYGFENDRDAVVFREKLKMEARNYLVASGEDYLLTLNAFNDNTFVPRRVRNRKRPFVVPRGFLEEAHTTILIPEGLHVAQLPKKFIAESDFGSYSVEVVQNRSSELVYTRKFLLREGTYPKERYQDFRSFLATVAQKDGQQLILNQNP